MIPIIEILIPHESIVFSENFAVGATPNLNDFCAEVKMGDEANYETGIKKIDIHTTGFWIDSMERKKIRQAGKL